MKKEVLKIAAIFLITIGVVLWGLNYIFFGPAPKSKAAGETMNLSFTPSTATVAANTDFTVNILAKPSINTVLRGYKVNVNFDKTKLAFKSIQYKVGIASAGLSNTTADITSINSSGIVYIVGEDTTAIGSTLTAVNGAEIASITFTALAATASTVTMTDSSFYSVNSDGTLFDTWTIAPTNLDVNGGGGGTCTSFSDDFSGTALNTDNWGTWLDLNPSSTITITNGQLTENLLKSTTGTAIDIDGWNKKLNGDFTAEVTSISTSNNGIGGQSFLKFGNNHVGFSIGRSNTANNIGTSVQSVTDSSDYQSQNLAVTLPAASPVKLKLERIGSTINMYYDLMAGAGYQLVRTFNNFYTGEGRVTVGVQNWDPTFPQVTGIFDNFSQTCGSGGTTGNVNLKMKLKFQGITKQPTAAQNSMTVKVKVQKDGETTSVDGTGTFTADAAGIWTGAVGVNIPTISGKYKILVKGPQHIQKKICDSTPTETTGAGLYRCSVGNVTLAAGDNNLDFSGILLLAGDLDQSGIVDSVDFGMVRNNLGKTDAATLVQADVNRDGKVDTQDFSLIIAALGIRTDEL